MTWTVCDTHPPVQAGLCRSVSAGIRAWDAAAQTADCICCSGHNISGRAGGLCPQLLHETCADMSIICRRYASAGIANHYIMSAGCAFALHRLQLR
jgi:hypothetical protein